MSDTKTSECRIVDHCRLACCASRWVSVCVISCTALKVNTEAVGQCRKSGALQACIRRSNVIQTILQLTKTSSRQSVTRIAQKTNVLGNSSAVRNVGCCLTSVARKEEVRCALAADISCLRYAVGNRCMTKVVTEEEVRVATRASVRRLCSAVCDCHEALVVRDDIAVLTGNTTVALLVATEWNRDETLVGKEDVS